MCIRDSGGTRPNDPVTDECVRAYVLLAGGQGAPTVEWVRCEPDVVANDVAEESHPNQQPIRLMVWISRGVPSGFRQLSAPLIAFTMASASQFTIASAYNFSGSGISHPSACLLYTSDA